MTATGIKPTTTQFVTLTVAIPSQMFERVVKTYLSSMCLGSFGCMSRWLLQKLNVEKQLNGIHRFIDSSFTATRCKITRGGKPI